MIKHCPICGKEINFDYYFGYVIELYIYKTYDKKGDLVYFDSWSHLQLFRVMGLEHKKRDYTDMTLNKERKRHETKTNKKDK